MLRYSEVQLPQIHVGLFPVSLLLKADQPTDVCTLVSRNGQGEAICRSCGLLQAGASTKMCTRIFVVLELERREADPWPPCVFLSQAHKHRAGFQLRITPDLTLGEKKLKRQRLHLPNSLSFLAPEENEHKILPSTSGTNIQKQ